ncbi:MAG: putative sugar O-methyltransferase [Rhodospirillaceae bacterium]|nr:putative sugar O-methyltransferase [Rhodospirillaceae bacterium]
MTSPDHTSSQELARPILEDIRAIFQKVDEHYKSTRYYETYKLNRWWGDANMKVMRGALADSQDAVDIVHAAHRTFMFSVNVPSADWTGYAVRWLLEEQRQRGFDLGRCDPAIQESKFSLPDNNVVELGRVLSPDFIRTVNIANEIMTYVPAREMRVLELGGGLGHLSRTLRLLGVAKRYVIVDLFETLVFSYCFLRLNFPDCSFHFVTSEEEKAADLRNFDFVFVPTAFTKILEGESFDLFANTASMGEMQNEAIRFWMDFIQNRISVRYLFTLNRFLNLIDPNEHHWRWEENEASVLYDARWRILSWDLEPRFIRCPYVDSVSSRAVKIVAERGRPVDAVADRAAVEATLRDLQFQDWSVLPHLPIAMSVLVPMVPDLGMSGTLFRLWDAVRLERNTPEVLGMMVRYLHHLSKPLSMEFEELAYYETAFLDACPPSMGNWLDDLRNVIYARHKALKLT